MNNKKYNYYIGGYDKRDIIARCKKQLKQKYEMDKFLEKIITPYIKSKELRILDACCGIGQLSNYLSKISSHSKILGVDQTGFLIKEAKKLWSNNKNLTFEKYDIYDLPQKYNKYFDLAINWKTLSWIPYYEEMVKTLLKLTKSHIFLSSLFYDGDIDFETKVTEYKTKTSKFRHNFYYNVYSLPKFLRFLNKCKISDFKIFDFNIEIDIPKINMDHMSTYTLKLENGKRLQISGSIIQSWKIIRIDL